VTEMPRRKLQESQMCVVYFFEK